jgi:hypothetical protein
MAAVDAMKCPTIFAPDPIGESAYATHPPGCPGWACVLLYGRKRHGRRVIALDHGPVGVTCRERLACSLEKHLGSPEHIVNPVLRVCCTHLLNPGFDPFLDEQSVMVIVVVKLYPSQSFTVEHDSRELEARCTPVMPLAIHIPWMLRIRLMRSPDAIGGLPYAVPCSPKTLRRG